MIDMSDENNLIYSNEETITMQNMSPIEPKQSNQDYLRKLKIRERQSKSRAAVIS